MIVVPIRTECATRRTPLTNYFLIGVNIAVFLFFKSPFARGWTADLEDRCLTFQSDEPTLLQFFTYQFLHTDAWHLFGNLLFLWVFGNSVNAKLGDIPYFFFYLSGGVFAAWGYAAIEPEYFQLVGASGAIAAVTTAYLALFPRSRVTVLVWFFFFIHFIEVPAMLLILLKIIVWDNIVAPGIGEAGNVAYGAHLSGYLFGFTAALVLLWIRAVARDQFDILALWRRWHQRRQFASAMSERSAAARAVYGSVTRVEQRTDQQRVAEEKRLDALSDLKTRIGDALSAGDSASAAALYERLMMLDPSQCLSERFQMLLGREFYNTHRYPQAAAVFNRFVECYPFSGETANVRLLLGIIYARDLRQYEKADEHLSKVLPSLRDDSRQEQCRKWLRDVRAALGKPVTEG